jgi:transketolase
MSAPAMRPMRDIFIETLCDRMEQDDSIWFLSADLGSPALDRLRARFPDRFLNTGIAEQNLVNLATGLALEGRKVYCYAIAPFLAMRAYEQIRVNLSISSQVRPVNVNLIGVGAGVSYPVSGPTHHCLEDLSIMRLLPNMTLFSPSDAALCGAFVDYSLSHQGPKYLRLDGKALPALYSAPDRELIETGFSELLPGGDTLVVATGYMTHRALRVARELGGIGVIDLFLLKPLDTDRLFRALAGYRRVVTMEEGFVGNGGLDSLVAGTLAGRDSGITLQSLGFRDSYAFELGTRDQVHSLNGVHDDDLRALLTNGEHQ